MEMARTNLDVVLGRRTSNNHMNASVHPAWLRLMRYCAELGHGEIEKLKIELELLKRQLEEVRKK